MVWIEEVWLASKLILEPVNRLDFIRHVIQCKDLIVLAEDDAIGFFLVEIVVGWDFGEDFDVFENNSSNLFKNNFLGVFLTFEDKKLIGLLCTTNQVFSADHGNLFVIFTCCDRNDLVNFSWFSFKQRNW